MKRYSLLSAALALSLLLAAINIVAISFYLYWTLWWFDNMMHFLGGFTLGFFAIYFFSSSISSGKISLTKGLVLSFIGVMTIAVAWEVFEYVTGQTVSTEAYPLDVLHDLISDTLGALLALSISKRILKSF